MRIYAEVEFENLTATLYESVERGFVVREAFPDGETDEASFSDPSSAIRWFGTIVAENYVERNLAAHAVAID